MLACFHSDRIVPGLGQDLSDASGKRCVKYGRLIPKAPVSLTEPMGQSTDIGDRHVLDDFGGMTAKAMTGQLFADESLGERL